MHYAEVNGIMIQPWLYHTSSMEIVMLLMYGPQMHRGNVDDCNIFPRTNWDDSSIWSMTSIKT